jgi:4-hydroxyphenylpyruvate dioxygenase
MAPKHERCIATVCLSGTLPEKLEAAAAAGFDAVEIFESDLLAFAGTPADVRDLAAGLGLRIAMFQPFRDFEAMGEPQRTRNLDRAERKFDLMQALGTDLLLVCSNTLAGAVDDDARAAADLAEMATRAAARNLRIGYEALAWGRNVNRWRHAWNIVQQADHPALGLVLDSFHTLALNDNAAGVIEIPADKVFFIQLADAPRLAMDVLSWSRHYRSFPGQGDLDVAGFLRDALAGGYAGPLSLEVFNDHFRAAPSRSTARDALRGLLLAEAQAGLAGIALPAPPRFDGIAFLEFAAEPDQAAALADFIATLGFRLAGRHRSKQVELWRAGRANFVLNSEPDSAAAEHAALHGTSCCAMALLVDDADAVLARAAALLAPEWHERTGPGERRIPALRAPDGTLVYLVQPDPSGRSIWEDDFDLEPDSADTTGIAHIDHVALAMIPGQMETFMLFHRAMFGFEAQPLQELPDPYGLVRSRAMVDPSRSIRMPLNISDARDTGTGRFVSVLAGAGIQHVAFACDDLPALMTRLIEAGFIPLPIPANYYDDLQARFSLDDDRLDLLRDLDVLYDRDEAGNAFLQAYTSSFDGRFFFELVQRDPGYDGFGAANAAVRLAAQAASRPDLDPY